MQIRHHLKYSLSQKIQTTRLIDYTTLFNPGNKFIKKVAALLVNHTGMEKYPQNQPLMGV